MIAVDTNVLVRLLTGDDARQAAVARTLFARESVWIAKTVLLETSWILHSLYGFRADETRAAFQGLLGLSNVQVEDEPAIAAALALAVNGIDLVDAIHVVSRPADATFVSFDRPLVSRAKRAGVTAISFASIS